MKTYFITGGAGFIGSSLIEKLIDNNKVVVLDNFNDYYLPSIKMDNIRSFLDNDNFILYKGDIRDRELLNIIFSCNNIDCVIHLAAQPGVRESIVNPYLYQEINYMGTVNLLEEMIKHNVKNIIFSSSSSVYGNNLNTPFKEDMDTSFSISPYATSKKACEVILHTYHKLYNLNTLILRFFTVYGPKQRPDLAINKFTNLILDSKPITMYGDGNSLRDYTYIDDIINGILLSIKYLELNNNTYEIINLGSSNPIKLIDVIKTLVTKLNKEAKVIRKEKQSGDMDATWADISKAQKVLGYKPFTNFNDGIDKYINWYNKTK